MSWRCAVVLAFSSCVTPLTLQPASVVPTGRARVTASTAAALADAVPNGAAALPELRVMGRHGFAPGWDVGLALQGGGVLGRSWQGGGAVDFKRELWSVVASGGGRWLVSLAPGVGYGTQWARVGNAGEATVAVPLYVGLQTPRVEWVFSPRFLERVTLVDRDGDGRREASFEPRAGAALGVFSRGPVALGVELGYHTSLAQLGNGVFTAAVGAHLELGP